jgi:uncharacterized membrane protein YidH (DUF202 family)
MNTQLNLKELERKAFRSTYQDGLWDIYYGLIVICMSIFVYRPASGYGPVNIVLALCAIAATSGLFQAGKKFITLPRMGQVQFGAGRKRRKSIMTLVLGVVILLQVLLLLFTLLVWENPEWSVRFKNLLPNRDIMDLVVASVGALIVGPSMILVAYFRDFPRGYFIAMMIALAVFLMIWLNQPVYPIVIGILIALPGFVLFVRFLKKYPLHKNEAPHD